MIKTWWGTMLEYVGIFIFAAILVFSIFHFGTWWAILAGVFIGPMVASFLCFDVPTRWKGFTHRRGWWSVWDEGKPNGGIELATPLEMPDGSPLHPTPCTVHVHGVSAGYLEPPMDRMDPEGHHCETQSDLAAYVYGRIKRWMIAEPVAFALYGHEMTWYVETPEEHAAQIEIREMRAEWRRNFEAGRRISPRTYDRYREMGMRYPYSLVDWGSPAP